MLVVGEERRGVGDGFVRDGTRRRDVADRRFGKRWSSARAFSGSRWLNRDGDAECRVSSATGTHANSPGSGAAGSRAAADTNANSAAGSTVSGTRTGEANRTLG
jgi:hypothetical protein